MSLLKSRALQRVHILVVVTNSELPLVAVRSLKFKLDQWFSQFGFVLDQSIIDRHSFIQP